MENSKFDKHSLYQKFVQNPKKDLEFFRKNFRNIYNTVPTQLREDFCGTGLLCCEWVKLNVCNTSVGLDIDKDTIDWGIMNNVSNLSSQDRVRLIQHNVLNQFNPEEKFDLIISLNYSHFLLTEREELLTYFRNVRRNIVKGMFIIDFYGGSHIYEDHEHDNGSGFYKFESRAIDVVRNIHSCFLCFKIDESYHTLFNYKFRVYSLIELKEMLEEAGFKRFKIFIKDVSDNKENAYVEYKELDFKDEYYPQLERYNGFLISYIK